MKTALTAEQSAELIKRGVSEGIVTTRIPKVNGRGFIVEYSPIFTLTDVCALLPKGVIHNGSPVNCASPHGMTSRILQAMRIKWASISWAILMTHHSTRKN